MKRLHNEDYGPHSRLGAAGRGLTMGILFSAPQYEFDIIREEWLKSVQQIAKNGVFVGGPAVSGFESSFASYTGSAGAVGVGSGTDALFLALKALGIGPGDEVITVSNTFIATVNAINHTGARPVLVDCDRSSYLIDLEQVKACVTSRTKAIIPVHLYGQMTDLRELAPWAEAQGIAVIEDCAQAAGARLFGKAAGSWGIMGCFSFYPDKNLGALGDGGAIISSSPEILTKLRKLRNHGGEARYQHEMPGFNSRLDPIQAAALQIKLRYLEEWSQRRREIAGWYDKYLQDTDSVILPKDSNASHVYHLYVIRIDNGRRDELKKHLQKKGILTAVQYPVPIHLTPAYSSLAYAEGAFPNSEKFAGEILSLPMHIALSEEETAAVASEIKSFLNVNKKMLV
ncbi:DegT/DnrJ/EryC1/StrS family aminotransferase [Paenibacillus sp. sptzw28]|uniref:DegT/DnrJ/EryC1/StrS family aminotransferase n=1 Tax=Paenibacillus sp. sptzw28 TaxID=715179 RepID=UPI001C6EDCD9|nr:DegT/DnrJ/EryC1/StrS family aminotransferase [Paenibacillus sp. sptzw28]QYR19392.1 DegT/DnrJ/EryC1/StrS family aminotransferase [Paenibacillus sp. sptzw28]